MFVDPRRWGALIGVAGGLVFIFSYAPQLGTVVRVGAGVVGIGLTLAILFDHYVRPTSLGAFQEPRPAAVVVYVCCVAGELTVIALGSRLLPGAGHGDLRPALIAGVVGLHFLPFAWAFGERMFYSLGLALLVLGGLGLIVGYGGITHAADAAAVLSGLVMLVLLALHAQGRFAHQPRSDVPAA
ncbi:MAG: hypothetical protein M3Y49_05705 [Actinomycetota bacterium]|nr:hypothetical protein [Actinomycetota bacterium]